MTVLDGSRHVTAVLTLAQLESVLESLSCRQAELVTLRYGLRDGAPRSRAETAALLGLSAAQVTRLEEEAFRLMRHPSRSQHLRDYVDSDVAVVPDTVRAGIMGKADAPTLGRCARHGYFELATGSALCSICPCPITAARSAASHLGRPRDYCSNACRQASYRRRRQARKDLGFS
ncbi:sigma factor-like helix-turn-helix DNA-binding protein [Amycolatopsis camponoti]|uniref:sigma factor-like helix-turn-helix DNA-binding protein n=1 Tax=Amycolatopsis camponoti TaxID=2606593 RepID=UPI0018C30B19|nr:sigma factor-like helix-turn-helix DNA-binding protein [Amycolatopsis camponoti]